ncbi:cytochrome P450 3A24-like [Galendromus occidentalis]|uniref:Cytochrome P450 3A24-like n=1 Tax=Galendromus occidentalis TaxID=34638 RepID=A0AAJ6QNM7_9ACAR|nr:cytochrome P450 3A24-like [Galendromus occidentalis]
MWLYFLAPMFVPLGIPFWNFLFRWGRLGVEYVRFFLHLKGLLYSNSIAIHEGLHSMVAKHGRLYGTFRRTIHEPAVSNVELGKEVLNRQLLKVFERVFEFQSNNPLWKNAVNNLPFERWKPVRSVMTLFFTSAKMQSIIPKLAKLSERFVGKLEVVVQTSKNEVALNKCYRGIAMGSMIAVSFGIEMDCLDDAENPFVKNGSGLFKLGATSSFILATGPAFRFVAAGPEGVVSLLDMLTYLYAMDPEAQEKALGELRSLVGERTLITYEDLQKSKYLEASKLKTGRLFPLSLIVERTCTQYTEIAGISIRPADSVEIPVVSLHRDPKYLPEPDDFLNERFIEDEDVTPEVAALLSSGDGSKSCLS